MDKVKNKTKNKNARISNFMIMNGYRICERLQPYDSRICEKEPSLHACFHGSLLLYV